MTKDFIVTLNYASKYGMFDATNKKQKMKAYKEFGQYADEKLGNNAPNGLNGVWWDEVKQFVEPGVIDWSFINNL
jgi:hypothetical protein